MKLKDTILEIQELKEENQDLKLENDFLKEEAGHEFARSLLGHTMTPEEIAIEQAEDRYVPYNGDDL